MPAVLPIRYLDTETTGFRPGVDKIIEIAIVGTDGAVLLNTLVRPKAMIPPEITRITGITNAMVRDAPTLEAVAPEIERLLTGSEMVAHNASFDRRMLGRLGTLPARETCTMKLAKPFLEDSAKLHEAALAAGHAWSGDAHRALADTLACRSVHFWALERIAEMNAARPAKPRSRTTLSETKATSPGAPRASSQSSLFSETPMPAAKPAVKTAPSVEPAEIDPVAFPCVTKANDKRLRKIEKDEYAEPTLRGKPWSREDDLKIGEMWMKGDDVPAILRAIPRTPVAIFARLQKVGLITQDMNPYHVPPQPVNMGSIW